MRREYLAAFGFVMRGATAAILIGLLAMSVALGQGLDFENATLIGERPDETGEPTNVEVSLYVFDIDEIDDIAQRFSIDMFVNVTWSDPRLALPESERAGRLRVMSMNEIWNPRGLLLNDRGLTPQLPRVAAVDDRGLVKYQQRLTGEMATDLLFKEFPFDVQILPIDLVSYDYSPEELQFSVESTIDGDGSFSTEGWSLRILEPQFGEYFVPATRDLRPRITYLIEATRNTRYYLFTMFLPMSLIVFMSWTVFWLPPEIVPSRIAISTASIFSLIAFGFSIRLSLPPVSYLTRADIFVIGCTLLVFLALGTAVIGSRWASSDRMGRALRLNRMARWSYVGLYLLVVVLALLL